MAEECHDLALVQLEVEVVDGHLGGAAVLVDPSETHDAEALLEALLEAGVDVQGVDCVLCRRDKEGDTALLLLSFAKVRSTAIC